MLRLADKFEFLKLRSAQDQPRGFSLIDVLIGLVLLALALMFGLQVSIAASRVTQSNMYISSAANLAEVKIEELRNVDYDQVINGADTGTINDLGEANGRFTRAWVVTEDSPVAGMKEITVTVSWDQMGTASSFDLTGVIAP
jgi:Tfp pilus assembly protein PilX